VWRWWVGGGVGACTWVVAVERCWHHCGVFVTCDVYDICRLAACIVDLLTLRHRK
jgi:hypothetical protein